MRFVSVTLLFIGIVAAYPEADKNPKIIGGQDATAAPFMVSLQLDRDRNGNFLHVCGGTIVTEEWILTSAHCITRNNLDASIYRVIAGQLDLATSSPTQQIRTVAEFRINEQFNPSQVNGPHDIALIRLGTPLTVVDGAVDYVRLPEFESMPYGEATVYGWGSTSRLQRLSKPIVDVDLCSEILSGSHVIYDEHICTGPLNGVGPCEKDAGGPLVQPYLGSFVRILKFCCDILFDLH